jgi:hypothetical protein
MITIDELGKDFKRSDYNLFYPISPGSIYYPSIYLSLKRSVPLRFFNPNFAFLSFLHVLQVPHISGSATQYSATQP